MAKTLMTPQELDQTATAMVNIAWNMDPSDGPNLRDILTVWFRGIEYHPDAMEIWDPCHKHGVEKLTKLKKLQRLLGQGRYDVLRNHEWYSSKIGAA